MNIQNYNFEGGLESGFKSLFIASDVELRTADDIDEGGLPDECIRFELDTGGPISNEHQNADGEYDNYAGTFEIEIRTPRVTEEAPDDPVAFKSRHVELVARTRQLLEEIGATEISTHWPAAHSPTKIKPTGTSRETDAEFRITTLSYEVQFRIT